MGEGGEIMKGYDLTKIVQQVKETERKAKVIEQMINNLLPSDVQELNKCIAINNMLDNN